jgi:hypothetical protein
MQKIAYPISLSETKEWAGEYIFKSGQIHFKEGKVFTPTNSSNIVKHRAWAINFDCYHYRKKNRRGDNDA